MSQKTARAARKADATERPARRGWLTPRTLIVAAVAVAAAALIGGVFASRGSGPARAVSSSSGSEVSFSGVDPITGRTVSTSDFAGKPLVINVWGSWCEGCGAEAADLRRFVAAHPEAQTIGLDLRDSRSGARAFYRQWRWRHPSIDDADGAISFRLGLQGTPTTFFLDARHRVVTQIIGATNRAGFEQGLRRALTAA